MQWPGGREKPKENALCEPSCLARLLQSRKPCQAGETLATSHCFHIGVQLQTGISDGTGVLCCPLNAQCSAET